MDFIRSGDLCIILTDLAKNTSLPDFIRSGRRWTISTTPCKNDETYRLYKVFQDSRLCKILTSLAKIYRPYGLYKVWGPLDNMNQPCEDCELCGLYKVWRRLHIIDQPSKNYHTCSTFVA